MSESVVTPGARAPEPTRPPVAATLPEVALDAALPGLGVVPDSSAGALAGGSALGPVVPADPVPTEAPPTVPRAGSGAEVLTEFRRVARRGVRGVRSTNQAADPERAVASDALLLASGHLGLVALLARVGGILALDSVMVAMYEHAARPCVWATAPVLAWSLLLVIPGRRLDPTLPAVRSVDLAVALLCAFLTQAYAPQNTVVLPAFVGFVMLGSSVGAWAAAAGVWGAVVPIALDVPVQAAVVEAAHHWRAAPFARAAIVGGAQLAGLALVAVLSFGAIAAVALALRRAASVAYDAGAVAAQAGLHRNLHDTVLPTLEAIALPAPAVADPRTELRRVRTAARVQATRIRHVLDMRHRTRPTVLSLREQLANAGAESAVTGVSVELVLPEGDDDQLSPRQRAALCDAAQEALRNVGRHAQVSSAVLLLDVQPDHVRVVVRDHGVGMDESDTPGFGITESIRARLAEVGGTGEVWSAPGRGTRVTMIVPAALPSDAR